MFICKCGHCYAVTSQAVVAQHDHHGTRYAYVTRFYDNGQVYDVCRCGRSLHAQAAIVTAYGARQQAAAVLAALGLAVAA